MFRESKHSSVGVGGSKNLFFFFVHSCRLFAFNFFLILLLHSTSAMSLLYECVNTVIAGN